jgi:hypothetical protein
MCSRCILNMFYLDVAKVYIAMAIHICFNISNVCCKRFYLDVAYVAVARHVCCKCIFQMFHMFQTYVTSVLFGCCIYFRHMLQASIQEILSVLDVYCKCVSRCCSCYKHMLQTCVYKYFTCFRHMLQKCFMLRH